MQGFKFVCLDDINNDKLYGTYLTTDSMGGLNCKYYNIYE